MIHIAFPCILECQVHFKNTDDVLQWKLYQSRCLDFKLDVRHFIFSALQTSLIDFLPNLANQINCHSQE